MARMNTTVDRPPVRTHEGGPGERHVTPIDQLRRTALTCLLWEDTFYESGAGVAARLKALIPQCRAEDVAALAVQARDEMYLRHLPLFLVRELARVPGNGPLVADTLERVIQRPDELTEYLAIYWGGKTNEKPRPEKLSKGSQRGLARAFRKFNEYSLAKYDRDHGVKLVDALRLAHSKPRDPEQSDLFKRVTKRTLVTPDTWETELSAGKDKKATFERLLREEKLGALATIRNLRNMVEAKVDRALIVARLNDRLDKVLPFRFLAAARHAPSFAQELSDAMLRKTADMPKLSGATHVVVDVSPSMHDALSGKSEMTREDAACGLAVLVRELAPACRVFAFSNVCREASNVRGIPLVEAIKRAVPSNGTRLGAAMTHVANECGTTDRVIVITDEQSEDRITARFDRAYLINVASHANGVDTQQTGLTRINGWSERVLDYVIAVEQDDAR